MKSRWNLYMSEMRLASRRDITLRGLKFKANVIKHLLLFKE